MKKFTGQGIKLISSLLCKAASLIKSGLYKFDTLLCSGVTSLIFITVYSFVMNILLEAALRKSFIEAFRLVIESPIVFFLNFFIVFASFSLIYIFRKRTFAFSLITTLWFVIVSVSYYLMCQRTTPFTVSDLRIIKSTFAIIPLYFTKFQIVLICIAIVAFIALLVLIYKKCARTPKKLSLAAFFPIQLWSIVIAFVVLYTSMVINAERFDNLPNKYKEHGFAYCFLYSLVDIGIDKPKNYSPSLYNDSRKMANAAVSERCRDSGEIVKLTADDKLLDDIYKQLITNYNEMPEYLCMNFSEEQAQDVTSHLEEKFGEYIAAASTGREEINIDNPELDNFSDEFDKPNVIFLQLESFYDVTNIEGYEYSSHPHPIYSMLKEKLPGGRLSVPSIGAGTANTEFEIMTGMDVSLFGIAEYPYLSVLQNQTCESMAYNAKDYGYTSHVIHNHKGTFYDRNKVFPNLGFDTFSSIENIPTIIRNQRNWAKDAMLIDPILDTLNSTEGKDLIYTISVQPHGRYPSDTVYNRLLKGQEPKIGVSGNEFNPENPGFTYYVNQLNEVDTFIGNLILELSFIDEPTILVFYGDHLPAFSVQKYWKLKEGDCYQTDYMIWNNCGIDFSDAKDLKTYQLYSYIFSKIGVDSGDINKLNRMYLDSDVEEYHYLRHTYQYAIFEDKSLKNTTSEIMVPSYEKTDIQYGITKTYIDDAFEIDGSTYITGKNFNEFTKITCNGELLDTEYINGGLITTGHNFALDDIIGTNQIGPNQTQLGISENTISFAGSMIVEEEMYDVILEMLLPAEQEVEADNIVIEDATLDFVTGQDEINMIQPDINKTAETN